MPQRRGRRARRCPLVACGARAALTPRHAPVDGRRHVRVELQRDDLGRVPGVEHGAQQWQLEPVHVHMQCVELRRRAGGRQQRTDGRRQRSGPRDSDAARRVVQREHFRPPRRRERHALALRLSAAAPVVDGIFLDGKPSPTRTEERKHRVERPLVIVQPLTVARANVDGEARPRHAHRVQERQEGHVGRPAQRSIREALASEELLQERRAVDRRRARQAAAVTALGCAARRHLSRERAAAGRQPGSSRATAGRSHARTRTRSRGRKRRVRTPSRCRKRHFGIEHAAQIERRSYK